MADAPETGPGASGLRQALLETGLVLGLVFGVNTAVLLLAGADPFAAYGHLVKGAFGSWMRFSRVVTAWIPLTLCACGLLYTFRIDLWNIGVEGQMIMGAVFATMILRLDGAAGAPGMYKAGTLLAAAAGGGVWAVLAGFLKTRGGVNEIFAGLGLNFVAQGAVLWLIFGPWKRPGVASMSGTEVFPVELWLKNLSGFRFSSVGLALTAAGIGVTLVILYRTRLGLAFRAIGLNRRAAYLFGLRPDVYMIIAMAFAGGFAGLAGSIQVAAVYHRLIPAISSNYGYLALLVVMLSNYNIRWAPLVAFFFACLNVGSVQLPMVLKLDSSFSGVIQGTLVLAAMAVHARRRRAEKQRKAAAHG